jgi:hypothetical protein
LDWTFAKATHTFRQVLRLLDSLHIWRMEFDPYRQEKGDW